MKNYTNVFAIGLFIINTLPTVVGAASDAVQVSNGWYEARLITPRTQYYVKKTDAFTLCEQPSALVDLHQYQENPSAGASSRSHIIVDDSAFSGASVDTAIHTKTKRKDEKKTTFVQYDKSNVQQGGKDFCVDATYNSSKEIDKCNYDGGHLVDHKFSAQGSHTDSNNYVPQHHYYNRWVKENIVKGVDGYLEIPLFTPNPPMIKVKDEERSDPIPIGILLVSLNASQISDMYYFPNNQYNYRTCQRNFKTKPSEIKSIFKIKKAFHKLLWPAILYDIKAGNVALANQLARETGVMGVVSALIDGMSVFDPDDDEEALSTLASSIIHQSNFEFSHVLEAPKKIIQKLTLGQTNPEALRESFNVFGSFLIGYSMKNSLKSELLSTHSRVMFLNIITDFIECSWADGVVSPQALKWIDNAYSDVYQKTIEGLFAAKEQMKLEDLMYFTNFFQRLSSSFIEPAFCSTLKVCEGMTIFGNAPGLITLLELLCTKTTTALPNYSQMQNLINLFIEAEDNIAYITETYPDFEYSHEIGFLQSSQARLLGWYTECGTSTGTYQNSPNSSHTFGYAPDYILDRLLHIGEDLPVEEDSDDESSNDDT